MTDPILEVQDIHCGYDGVPVIHGISLEVAQGELVAIVGASGAGKTTTMRSIAGLMHPFSGKIFSMQKDITRLKAHETIKLGISYVPEGRRLFSKLSIIENLELGAFIKNDRKE